MQQTEGMPGQPQSGDWRAMMAMMASVAAAKSFADGITVIIGALHDALVALPDDSLEREMVVAAHRVANALAADNVLLLRCLKAAGAKHTTVKIEDTWKFLNGAPKEKNPDAS